MTKVQIPSKGGDITDEHFADEAPPPGSSDKRYSEKAKRDFESLAQKVMRMAKQAQAKK